MAHIYMPGETRYNVSAKLMPNCGPVKKMVAQQCADYREKVMRVNLLVFC